MSYQNLNQRALRAFGLETNQDIAIEECSELIKAITKIKRTGIRGQPQAPTAELVDKLLDELVDVQLNVDWLIEVYGLKRAFAEHYDVKWNRLAERVREAEKELQEEGKGGDV